MYGKSTSRHYYRLADYAADKRHIRNFRAYSEAKAEAERVVRQLADGSHADALNAAQARDALAALERLADFYRATGRRVSLLAVASEYAEAVKKLNGRTLAEAVDGFLSTVATIRRMDLNEANPAEPEPKGR